MARLNLMNSPVGLLSDAGLAVAPYLGRVPAEISIPIDATRQDLPNLRR